MDSQVTEVGPRYSGRGNELLFQIFTLLLIFIVVHGSYVLWVRPNAEEHLAQQRLMLAQDANHQEARSIYVVLRDYEQEACFVLMFWAMGILGFKAWQIARQQKQLDHDFLQLPSGIPPDPQVLQDIAIRLYALPTQWRRDLLPRALIAAVERYQSTGLVQDVSAANHAVCEAEAERLETELSIIRYIAWAIPSVGFIGTVRGIGDALAQAHRAVQGDIAAVTESLGVAFNSTFVALVLSIILMFFIHQLQQMQERLVLDSEHYVDHWLIRRLRPARA